MEAFHEGQPALDEEVVEDPGPAIQGPWPGDETLDVVQARVAAASAAVQLAVQATFGTQHLHL